MNSYYGKKQFIACVNRKSETIGKIEKWEAHKKGVLHKAISITLIYNNQYILQHRRHPAFDGVFDLTSSSHQLLIKDKLQSSKEAAYECLKREWDLKPRDLIGEIKELGEIYYKADDLNSIYREHEMCVMLTAKLKKLPLPNFDYSYGYSLVPKDELTNKKTPIYKNLAPWCKVAIKKSII